MRAREREKERERERERERRQREEPNLYNEVFYDAEEAIVVVEGILGLEEGVEAVDAVRGPLPPYVHHEASWGRVGWILYVVVIAVERNGGLKKDRELVWRSEIRLCNSCGQETHQNQRTPEQADRPKGCHLC